MKQYQRAERSVIICTAILVHLMREKDLKKSVVKEEQVSYLCTLSQNAKKTTIWSMSILPMSRVNYR